MFRTAVMRSAAAGAARSVTRNFSSRAFAVSRTAAAHFTKPMAPSLAILNPIRSYSAAAGLTKDDVQGRIMSLLAGFDKVSDASKIQPNAHFANDLGLDSLDTVEVVMAIEEEFSIEIPDKDADTIHSIDKAVDYIMHQPDAH